MTGRDDTSAPVGAVPGGILRPDSSPSEAVAAALRARGLMDLRPIGAGASSIVYRARDERLARDVAVKVIDASRATPAAVGQFEREVSMVAQLRHPNIVPLYDAGIAGDGSVFAVMPLASGQTLRDLERAGPLPLRVVILLAREIADALSYAHGRGIIHRDIKPENILIEDEHAVIADFGLAIPRGERLGVSPGPGATDGMTAERSTESGTIVGTPLYVSPEQIMGEAGIDARADVFSLGAMCYEMLTGRPPFQGASVEETIAARFLGSPPPMKAAGVRVPAGVEAVVLRALRKNPDERQASARVFRDDLTRAYMAATRPTWKRVVVGAAIVAGIIGVVSIALRDIGDRLDAAQLDPRRVVVADLDNETADSAYATWGDLAGDIIATQLARVPGLEVVTSERWLPRTQRARRQPDPEGLKRVAVEVNAATVVVGGYYLSGAHIELVLEVTDARSGVLLRTYGPVAVSPKAPDSTVIALGARVAAALDTLVVRRGAAR